MKITWTGTSTICGLILASLCVSAAAREILSYSSDSYSRKEEGQPGSHVTGEWSWLDHNGVTRKIWYVADENGFRAFGDVVPKNEWSENTAKSLPIGASIVPALQTNKTEAENAKQLPEIHKTESTNASVKTAKDIQSSIIPSSHKETQVSLIKGLEKQESKKVNTNSFLLASNNFDNKSNGRLIADTKVVENVDVSKDSPISQSNVSLQRPERIPGSSLVLISRTRTPFRTSSATRVSQIKPQPVEVTGAPATPTKGILSAPRAKKVLNVRRAKALEPISASTSRIVPRPSRVNGMINLDNFLRPAHVSSANSNRRTTRPSQMDHDYYYYDYNYDEPRHEKNIPKSRLRTVRSEESSESFEDFDYTDDLSGERS